ncbi:MAG: hypothetical protein VYB44_00920 [Bacteroidota bacterium]|nr:hypothetical protein [Bacteroidota bacterium]
MVNRILIATFLIVTSFQASAQLFKDELKRRLLKEFDEDKTESILLCMEFFEHELSTFFNLSENSGQDPIAMYIEYTEENYPEFEIPLDFSAQQELYQKLDTHFFIQTWDYGLASYGPDGTTYILLNLKSGSPLFHYLKKKSKKVKTVTDYLNRLNIVGDISPASIGQLASLIPLEHQQNIELRILLTFHYLTLNDRIKRRDKM